MANNEEYVSPEKQRWILACEFDNIPVDSLFVIFSEENPYAN
jgi:hypothetical protein